jgi:hypothetical protein
MTTIWWARGPTNGTSDKRTSDHLVQAVSFDDFATQPNNGDLWADEER